MADTRFKKINSYYDIERMVPFRLLPLTTSQMLIHLNHHVNPQWEYFVYLQYQRRPQSMMMYTQTALVL